MESTSAAWSPGQGWRVDPEPAFRLGDDEDDPSSQFFRVLDVALLAGAAVWREWGNLMESPGYEPAFDQLLTEPDGTIWARRFQSNPVSRESPTWDVFDPTGVYLGPVSTPGALTMLAIRDGLLAGVYRDELGVEYVSVHRVVGERR
ncbi:MAG: hypothetical protein OXK77_11490 [Gemmatimonadota bacterium]|nr:hypothetical protein [Gemmatimonadota bacterium]MDE2864427.1 hypothetical protein [Gemmatimonadota bacterium]